MTKIKLLVIFGTRPEAIKLAPLVLAARGDERFESRVCSTGQHDGLLGPVLDFFGISVDFELSVMRDGQSLAGLSSAVLLQLTPVFEAFDSDYVVVQGDTTTCFVAALAAFYHQKRVVHVEAGLRSLDRYSPFPEEMNRVLTSRISELHFAPTEMAREALAFEGITEGVFVVGNTGIDALLMARDRVCENLELYRGLFSGIDFSQRVILLTMHRRENLGSPIASVCDAVFDLLHRYPDIELVFPVHPNPDVRAQVFERLSGVSRVHLLDPLGYPEFVFLMDAACLILTDSGGIQEEAPALGTPVLVLRDVTERVEVVDVGAAEVVGTSQEKVVESVSRLLDSSELLAGMRVEGSPYGDGSSSGRILECLCNSGGMG